MLAVALPHRANAIVSIAGLSARGAIPDPDRVAFMQSLADSREQRELLVRNGMAGRYTDTVAREIVAATWGDIDGRALVSRSVVN
jgi:hypothetical protein